MPKTLRIGDWRFEPSTGQLTRGEESVRLELRTMRLLRCLVESAGEVVSIETLLNVGWPGVAVSPDSVYQAVAALRRLLGDDPRHPVYIATVPRLGYRLIAQVTPCEQELTAATNPPMTLSSKFSLRTRLALGLGIVLAVGVAVGLAFFHKGPHKISRGTVSAASSKESLAVLPFLDLTEGMKEEEFADGMTEELIDKLSKLPGLQVPAPTSSFYYKNKQLPVADIARAMGVVYVLDGSIRKSGDRIRVAARLMRADNAYVIWTETYDRPADDLLWVQDDIATRVATALQRSNHWGKSGVSE